LKVARSDVFDDSERKFNTGATLQKLEKLLNEEKGGSREIIHIYLETTVKENVAKICRRNYCHCDLKEVT